MERPNLAKDLAMEEFRQYYYLKEELVAFCRQEKLQTTGSKKELTERISYYLATGEKTTRKRAVKKNTQTAITLETKIEEEIVCSEVHRVFLRSSWDHVFLSTLPFKTG